MKFFPNVATPAGFWVWPKVSENHTAVYLQKILHGLLERLFELAWRPSRALNLPGALLQERNGDTVRCAARGEFQESVKNSWRKPRLCVCWKRTCLHRSLMVNRIELVTRPGMRKATPTGCLHKHCKLYRLGGTNAVLKKLNISLATNHTGHYLVYW